MSGYGFGPLTRAINADLAINPIADPLHGSGPQTPQAAFDADFLSVGRGSDRAPGDSGQWGVALRYLAEDFNDTEFGFYYMNYHSRLPTVGARMGSRRRNPGRTGGCRGRGSSGFDSHTASDRPGHPER